MAEERSAVTFTRHFLSKGPTLLLFIILVIVAFYLSARYPWSIQPIAISEQSDFVFHLPLFALPPVLLLFYILHILRDRRYIIGADYVRSIQGLLSLRKKDVRIELQNIRGIEIDRSLYERILNLGTLHITSTMSSEHDVMLVGVLNPSNYRDLILERMKHVGPTVERDTLGLHDLT